MKRYSISLIAGVSLALLASAADAQTLYKLIDKNGKVTYSEKPPADFDGQVIRLDIDPKANTATLPKPAAAGAPASLSPSKDATKATAKEARIKAAKERLEQAKAALADALANPKEGDVFPLGVAKRGPSGGSATPGAIGSQGSAVGGGGVPKAPGQPKKVAPGVDPLGSRMGMSDEYRARIEALQKAVKDAEEELERIERE